MIITSIDHNYEWNLMNDFLPTLFKYYNGPVAIIDYGLTEEALKKISEYNLHIKKYAPLGKIVNIRMRDTADFLRSFTDISHVMMIDSGDVWFQDSFEEVFDLCKNSIGVIESADPGTQTWLLDEVAGKIKDKELLYSVLRNLKCTKIIEAGMICGPRRKVMDLLKKTYEMLERLNSDFFGMDMIALNYLIRKKNIPYINLPATYDYSLIRFTHETRYEDDIVYNRRQKVKIVHNSGDDHRVLNRKT